MDSLRICGNCGEIQTKAHEISCKRKAEINKDADYFSSDISFNNPLKNNEFLIVLKLL